MLWQNDRQHTGTTSISGYIDSVSDLVERTVFRILIINLEIKLADNLYIPINIMIRKSYHKNHYIHIAKR